VACAAAMASLAVIEQQDAGGRASRLGAVIGRTLDRWRGAYPQLVIEATARGLLASFGMADQDDAVRVQALASELGCRIRVDNDNQRAWLGLRPPLLIAEAELQRGLASLEEALAIVSSTTRGR
jgi:acetylornithine/succinyldiaminopimelate/putrescine aminotransferase